MSHTEVTMKEGCRVTLTVPPDCGLAHTGASPNSSEYTVERRSITGSQPNTLGTVSGKPARVYLHESVQQFVIQQAVVLACDLVRMSGTNDVGKAAEQVAQAAIAAARVLEQ